jgi:hypothetical protein
VPRATVKKDTVGPLNLTTLEGGWVKLCKLSYGEKNEHQELVSRLSSSFERDGKKEREIRLDMALMNGDVYLFRKCIVDHNLEDEDGRKLDLSNPVDAAKLDPAVGDEVTDLIDKVNSSEDLSPFLSKPTKPLSTEQK